LQLLEGLQGEALNLSPAKPEEDANTERAAVCQAPQEAIVLPIPHLKSRRNAIQAKREIALSIPHITHLSLDDVSIPPASPAGEAALGISRF
jgi:hypothetical protein